MEVLIFLVVLGALVFLAPYILAGVFMLIALAIAFATAIVVLVKSFFRKQS